MIPSLLPGIPVFCSDCHGEVICVLGIVDVGGGLRGIYGAGFLDYCLEHGISFDYCIGVSAGSANLAAYIAGQRGRNYHYYHDYAFREAYMGLGQYRRTGSYINLDYIYGTLSNSDGERPLDYPAIAASDKRLVIVATDAKTGRPVYFTKDDLRQDDYAPIKASSCVPVINQPYPIGERLCFDGGISDPIPIEKAFADGCDRVIVVLTRPKDEYRHPGKDRMLARRLRRAYPQSAKMLAERAFIYNDSLIRAKAYERAGEALIVAPKSIYKMNTLTKNQNALALLYQDGLRDARWIWGFIRDR